MNMETSDVIHVCAISDSGYCIPTIVMLSSAKENKRPGSRYKVHCVFCDDVGDFYRRKLMELSSPDFEVKLYNADVSVYKDVRPNGHVPLAALLKLNLAEILPDVDKVLFIDGDVIVRKDLGELFRMPLEGNAFAAVRDMGGELKFRFHEKIGVEKYINSGVLLMDLALFRREAAGKKMTDIQLYRAPESWFCLEQDNLNTFFEGRILFLPTRFNCMLPLFLRDIYSYTLDQVNEFYGECYGSFEELDDDAVIMHFAGECMSRPWLVNHGTYANVWQQYYDRSPMGNVWLRRVDREVPSERRPGLSDSFSGMKESGILRTSGRLFGILPFLRIYTSRCCTKVYLFYCIPLLRIKKTGEKRCVKLFGFLPLWYSKTRLV